MCFLKKIDCVYLSCCFVILSEPPLRANHIPRVAFVVCSAHPEGTSSITGSQPTINMSSGALDGSDLSVARISILSIRWHSCWEARNSTKFTTGLGWNSSTFLNASGSNWFCTLLHSRLTSPDCFFFSLSMGPPLLPAEAAAENIDESRA